MSKERSLWIALDGIDAVGKTTQTKLVVKKLVDERGKDAIGIEEFSDSYLGKMIHLILERNRFFSLTTNQNSPHADVLTLMADLVFKYETLIHPVLEEGKMVVSDRGTCSFIGYQIAHLEAYENKHYSKGKIDPHSWVKNLVASSFICPNLTILLSLSEEQMTERIIKRGESAPREEEKIFLKRVSQIMDELPEFLTGKVIRIDGGLSVEEVNNKIMEVINLHFPS